MTTLKLEGRHSKMQEMAEAKSDICMIHEEGYKKHRVYSINYSLECLKLLLKTRHPLKTTCQQPNYSSSLK